LNGSKSTQLANDVSAGIDLFQAVTGERGMAWPEIRESLSFSSPIESFALGDVERSELAL
jgi:hypothetical protein